MAARFFIGQNRIKPLKLYAFYDYNPGMLTRLYISNIVLIEKLNLEFGAGLNVLTGETGAGKSILMDSLALALGARSDVSLIRHGYDTASVIAEFDDVDAKIKNILDENGLEPDDALILRRTLSLDGKSRAWVNDIPVSIKTLKQIGDTLVEIHGQFANHTLLNPTTHRESLDVFGAKINPEYNVLLQDVYTKYNVLHTTESRLQELEQLLKKTESEREFLEHNVRELANLNVRIGEEDELATQRATLMNAEKDAAILADANNALNPRGESLEAQIFAVAHILQRIKSTPNPYAEQIDALYNAAQIVSDVSEKLIPTETDVDDLDSIEERLFAIRAAARKHRVSADELPETLKQMSKQLDTIENSDTELKKMTVAVKVAHQDFVKSASRLTDMRQMAADALRNKMLAELPDLKLGNADFVVSRTATTPGANGIDDIVFMIKTNPGMPFAPLHRAASGGELARFMLALRVILSSGNNAHTFVFDEIDTGISGATASAVGQRLYRLARTSQALVITHSAQVAGYADRHFKIAKHTEDKKTITTVSEISGNDRVNEIARIISGDEITPESLATARTLIKDKNFIK